jgi:hypothetical protein
VPNALTLRQFQVLECVRDGQLPWDCVPDVLESIACVNELVARGFIEEKSGNYSLTDAGQAARDAHIAMCRGSTPRNTPE